MRVRVEDLETGRRVRLPRTRDLVCVISVTQDEHGTYRVDTDGGIYPCASGTLIDAEEDGEVLP